MKLTRSKRCCAPQKNQYDLVVVSLGLKEFDVLRLCSQIRSVERLRHLPILIVIDPDENARLMRGLDLGGE